MELKYSPSLHFKKISVKSVHLGKHNEATVAADKTGWLF